MEFRRALVIAAIAVVTYMLILAWQRDYGQVRSDTPPATSGEAIRQDGIPTESDAPVLPQTDAVPSLPATAEVEDATPSLDTPARPSEALVSVATNVMRLQITPRGGDIVRLALPHYPISIEAPDQPFPLLESGGQRHYVAQSGLIGPNGTDGAERPLWHTAATSYRMDENDHELNVDFTLDQGNGVQIIKRYTFQRDSYLIRVSHIVRNQGNSTWQGALYGQIRRDGSDDPGKTNAGFIPMPTYLGAAYWTAEKPYNKLTFSDMRDKPLNTTQAGGWVAMLQHYFVSAWVPDQSQSHTYSSVYLPQSGEYLVRFVSPLTPVKAGEEAVLYSEFYAGPKNQDILGAISPGLNMTVDYGWLWFIAQPIFALLVFLQSGQITVFGTNFDIGFGVGNWGVAIILLTLIIKLLFFKLSATSYRSMAKMRKVTPEMTRIREEHKNDKQKQQLEMMKLFKEHRINPLGGCLPILVQMPVFISLYYVLLESVELRQAPFFGYIQDLSVMDPYFILPLLMGLTSFIQMRLNPTPADPTQAQVMKWMPIIFTAFMLFFPAGLVLYWVTNNVLSILQQWVITRSIEKE